MKRTSLGYRLIARQPRAVPLLPLVDRIVTRLKLTTLRESILNSRWTASGELGNWVPDADQYPAWHRLAEGAWYTQIDWSAPDQ